jgi:hypothetical protein
LARAEVGGPVIVVDVIGIVTGINISGECLSMRGRGMPMPLLTCFWMPSAACCRPPPSSRSCASQKELYTFLERICRQAPNNRIKKTIPYYSDKPTTLADMLIEIHKAVVWICNINAFLRCHFTNLLT